MVMCDQVEERRNRSRIIPEGTIGGIRRVEVKVRQLHRVQEVLVEMVHLQEITTTRVVLIPIQKSFSVTVSRLAIRNRHMT